MSITATVDGTNYSGIDKITTGGKTITLTESGGGGSLPSNVSDIKSGSFTLESDKTSGNYDVAHGCSSAPTLIYVWSDYRTHFTDSVHPANTTMVEFAYDDLGKIKYSATVATSYSGNADVGTAYSQKDITSTDEGMITTVDSTNFTIKTHTTRRLAGGMTYKWIAIVAS